jgi:hypothetical protein
MIQGLLMLELNLSPVVRPSKFKVKILINLLSFAVVSRGGAIKLIAPPCLVFFKLCLSSVSYRL